MKSIEASKQSLNIYDYLDFRKFLKDLTQELKSKRQFNLKRFSDKAGIRSQGFLKMVIDGDRRLTPDMSEAFCRALNIKAREKLYFDTLVQYNQARDPDQRREYFEMLNDLRPKSERFSLEKKLHRYLTHGYYVTIREMTTLDDFREDYNWIGKRCAPPVSAGEAKEAVETLLELGLLRRDEAGKLATAQGFVSTNDRNTQALEAYHFHDAVLQKARYQLSYLEQERRSYQAMTLSLPKSLVDEIITKYYALRDDIVRRANEIGVSDEVYQINFQLFPVTWKDEGEGS